MDANQKPFDNLEQLQEQTPTTNITSPNMNTQGDPGYIYNQAITERQQAYVLQYSVFETV